MVNMEIFWSFFWALMAADAVLLCLVASVLIGRKLWLRHKRRKWSRPR